MYNISNIIQQNVAYKLLENTCVNHINKPSPAQLIENMNSSSSEPIDMPISFSLQYGYVPMRSSELVLAWNDNGTSVTKHLL